MTTTRRLRRTTGALVALGTGMALAAGLGSAPAVAEKPVRPAGPPSKVLVVVVDGLSREMVQRYDMRNVARLMKTGADAPRSYLGHLGAVTVVTHNVITTGALPKNMGWTDEGYRDVDGVLADQATNGSGVWLTSNFGPEQMFPLQEHAGYPKLADYLHAARPGSSVVAISPKTYAAWGLGGEGADRTITFSGRSYDCDGDGTKNWRGPAGINVPDYLAAPECGRFYVDSASSLTYDSDQSPARMYPLDGNRYTVGFDTAHEGGDVWAADAAVAIMKNEDDWSGVFVTLPGIDRAAHMWGAIDDDGGDVPMTHVAASAAVADAQVGKLMTYLEDSGEIDDTLVVLTADHGSVPGRHFHGLDDGTKNRGYYNWYYGTMENDEYLAPQPALQPLVDTGNVAMSYSDSMLRAWLKDTSPARLQEAVRIMAKLPDVSAVWVRQGGRIQRATKVRYDRMPTRAERRWFDNHARELMQTTAAPHAADVFATLVDDTTYSVAGDHGGVQRRSQQVPIVFAGGDVGSRDLRAAVRSVDIMPTVLRAMRITPTHRLDGKAYALPGAPRRR